MCKKKERYLLYIGNEEILTKTGLLSVKEGAVDEDSKFTLDALDRSLIL